MENTILSLIDRYNQATSEADKQSIKSELFFQHLHLSAEQRYAVWDAMQPFFDEIEQELIAVDPLACQAYELLNRHKLAKVER